MNHSNLYFDLDCYLFPWQGTQPAVLQLFPRYSVDIYKCTNAPELISLSRSPCGPLWVAKIMDHSNLYFDLDCYLFPWQGTQPAFLQLFQRYSVDIYKCTNASELISLRLQYIAIHVAIYWSHSASHSRQQACFIIEVWLVTLRDENVLASNRPCNVWPCSWWVSDDSTFYLNYTVNAWEWYTKGFSISTTVNVFLPSLDSYLYYLMFCCSS